MWDADDRPCTWPRSPGELAGATGWRGRDQVNLRNGVPPAETPITTVACAGTLLLEFGVLSQLTGDPPYGIVAEAAMEGLWSYRSKLGLLGTHLDVNTGRWVVPVWAAKAARSEESTNAHAP